MSQWEAKGVRKCTRCGTTRLESALSNGSCADASWCAKRTAVPSLIAQELVRISEDLEQLGCAGFEVEGKKYVLYGVSNTAQTWATSLEVEFDE